MNPQIERVAQRVNYVEQEMASVKTDLGYIRSELGGLKQDIHSLVERVTSKSQTNWGVIGTWTAVLLSFVVFHSDLNLQPIRERLVRHYEASENLEKRLQDRTWKIAEASGKVNHLEYIVEKLDTNLQREMRDLDAKQEQAIKALDTVLQREMRLLIDTQKTEVRDLDKAIAAIQQNRFSSRDGELLRTMLEKQIDTLSRRLSYLEHRRVKEKI